MKTKQFLSTVSSNCIFFSFVKWKKSQILYFFHFFSKKIKNFQIFFNFSYFFSFFTFFLAKICFCPDKIFLTGQNPISPPHWCTQLPKILFKFYRKKFAKKNIFFQTEKEKCFFQKNEVLVYWGHKIFSPQKIVFVKNQVSANCPFSKTIAFSLALK